MSQCIPAKLVGNEYIGFSLKPTFGGICSKLQDLDLDGIGFNCDNCRWAANPEQHNCNRMIEKELGEPYPYRGDACDPNPCARLFEFATIQPIEKDEVSTKDLWTTFSINPQRLGKSVPECPSAVPGLPCFSFPAKQPSYNTSYLATPKASVGLRVCDCKLTSPSGSPVTANIEECRNTLQCPLNAVHYEVSTKWNKPKLIASPSPLSLPPKPVEPFTDHFDDLPMESSREAPGPNPGIDNLALTGGAEFRVSWDLTADGASNQLGFLSFGRNGVLWGAVRDVPQMNSASKNAFRPWSNSYVANFFGQNFAANVLFPALACKGPCEIDACLPCQLSTDIMDLVVHPDGKVFVQGMQQTVEITEAFSPAVVELLAQPNVRWIGASEPATRAYRGDIAFAGISPDATRVVDGVARVGGLMQPVSQSRIGITDVSLAGASTPASFGPTARVKYGAVLSSTERSVFVVGGTTNSGVLAEDLWQFDLTHSSWRPVAISGPKPRNVLAATYLPSTRSLFILDETGGGHFNQARLLRYDIRTKEMTVLGSWPRSPLVDRVDLSTTSNGTLLLSGSSSTLSRVAGVVIAPHAHHVSVEGGFARAGVLALEPTLTARGLTLPLKSGVPSGVQHSFIPASELLPGAPKGAKGKKEFPFPESPVDVL